MGTPKKQPSELNFARLIDCRFLRIHADIGKNVDEAGSSGGILRANISATLNENIDGIQADRFVASVNIDLAGYPQGVSGKPEAFAFKIVLTLAGVFEWVGKADRPKTLKESPLAAHLCQQLYPMAIAEAKAVAQRLGFNNLDLPWQLGASPKKAAAPPAKPQRGKRTPPKKKAV